MTIMIVAIAAFALGISVGWLCVKTRDLDEEHAFVSGYRVCESKNVAHADQDDDVLLDFDMWLDMGRPDMTVPPGTRLI